MLNKNILAAMFACSNLGHEIEYTALQEVFRQNAVGKRVGFAEAVSQLCGHLMESDEHENVFLQEAGRWYADFSFMTDQYIQLTWPDMVKRYNLAFEVVRQE